MKFYVFMYVCYYYKHINTSLSKNLVYNFNFIRNATINDVDVEHR
jgi:hypothetical protein